MICVACRAAADAARAPSVYLPKTLAGLLRGHELCRLRDKSQCDCQHREPRR